MGKWIDYYKLLELSNKASSIEIKNAYRQKSKIYHPDINHNKNSVVIMQQLNDAYDILSSTMKRYRYDIEWDRQNTILINGNGDSEGSNTDINTVGDKLINIINILLVTSICLFIGYMIIVMIINNTFSLLNLFIILMISFLAFIILSSLPIVIWTMAMIIKTIFMDLW